MNDVIILGKGKEGIVTSCKRRNRWYAVKQFKKRKSPFKIALEAKLQQIAAKVGISPKVRECNIEDKFIRMDRLETSLYKIMKSKGGKLNIKRQRQIIKIIKTLDKIKIFHGDPNPANFMEKDGQLYIIDFGFAEPITDKIVKKYDTTRPNQKYMILGLILKCKESFGDIKYSYLRQYISKSNQLKFNI